MSIELYSPKYFGACAVGGVLACGITHAAVTPIDLVKTNQQANPEVFKGMIQGFRVLLSGGGAKFGYLPGFRGIWKGVGPTFVGYSIQGAFKFGFYEVFKYLYSQPFGGPDNLHGFQKDLVYIAGSASAEFLADLAYCPFEAVKVRVQTRPDFAVGMMDGLPKMVAEDGFSNLYAGLGPLWARQIPYTIIKFVAFERIATAIYGQIFKSTGRSKADMSTGEQTGVVFASGYLAGILCGAVSHPADTLVSKINKIKMDGSLSQKAKVIYSGDAKLGVQGIGMAGLWAGFGPRVLMIGTLTGLQWFIYGAFKAAVGLPTPGAAAPKTEEK
jgi:solute carrier family 25 phosphate transporter 3